MAPPEAKDSSRPDGGGDEDDEEIDESGYKSVRDAVLFAIDVSSTMLKPGPTSKKNPNPDSATLAALKCAHQLMQQRIISNPNDMMGVLLFGTEQSMSREEENPRGTPAYPHTYLLADLDIPLASDVKRLRDLVQDEEESSKILVPTDEPVSMSTVLFCANQIFTVKAPNFTSRRLFLVTDNDNPHGKDKQAREAAAVRAKDLYDLGVIIELFPIAQPDKGFDRTVFYDDIVYRGLPTDPDAPAPVVKAAKTSSTGDGIDLLQSLLSSINSKAAPRRALFSLPLEIGPGLKIGVKGYTLIKRQEVVKSCYVWVGGEKVQIAVGTTSHIADDTARTVEKAEIRKAFSFGGEQVTFTEEENKALRSFGDPIIRIIGFKPLRQLPIWANRDKAPVFVYPDEIDFVGSTRVFSALQQKLLSSEKFALVWYIPRRNASPSLAAMIPGAEKLDESGDQTEPPGLWIIPLPFADDIRQNPEAPPVRATSPVVDVMKEVVDQLRLPRGMYDPKNYPNPSLQWFYRILQAAALDEEIPDPHDAVDKTVPKFKQINKRTGPSVAAWRAVLDQEWANSKATGALPNRSLKRVKDEDDDAGQVAKKQKKGGELTDTYMKNLYATNALPKLTVADLKEWAKKKKLRVDAKKKPELIALVEEYFERI